jgi:hypothetical protein
MAMRARSELPLALLCAVACAASGAPAPKRGSKVIEIRRQIDNHEPAAISVPAIPILDVDLRVPLPVALVSSGAACSRIFCNASMNSRLPGAAPAKALKIRWQAPFAPSFQPSNVLQDGNRVLAYGGAVFRLFDVTDGKLIVEGRTGSSGMVLDSDHGLFYFVDGNGYLTAHRLSDGGQEFALSPSPKDAWPFIARRGSMLFNLAVELPQPWKNQPPNSAILEHFDLPDTFQLDDKIILNLTGSAALYLGTAAVKIAMGKESVVLGLPGSILLSSIDLHPTATLDGDFVPQALSLDELGRIHLVVRSSLNTSAENAYTALWVLTPSGQRTAKVIFKPEYGAPFGQPIIGYDHRIFLLHSGLSAYDAHGDFLWERWPKARVAGAGITSDGQLLVTAGDLSAYDEKGERRLLFMLPGVSLVTPPAMSANGEIFVASKDTVYCLASER